MMRGWWWCMFVLVALAACAQPASEPPQATQSPAVADNGGQQLLFPQLKPAPEPRPFPQALVKGALELEGACLRLQAMPDNVSYLVIWAPQIVRQGNSLTDTRSGRQALVGAVTELSGGVILKEDPLLLELQAPPPADCPGPYWLAGSIQ